MALKSVNSIGEEILNYSKMFLLGACVGAGGVMAYGYNSYLPKQKEKIESEIREEYSAKTAKLYNLIQEKMSPDQQMSLLESYLEENHEKK